MLCLLFAQPCCNLTCQPALLTVYSCRRQFLSTVVVVSVRPHTMLARVMCMCYSMGRALLALRPCACMSLAKLCVFAGVTDLRRFGGALVTLGGIMDWCARSSMVGGLSPELTGPHVTTNQPTNLGHSNRCFSLKTHAVCPL